MARRSVQGGGTGPGPASEGDAGSGFAQDSWQHESWGEESWRDEPWGDEPWQQAPRRESGRVLRVLALIAVAAGVAAVTAAACALSYTSIHILAGQAGVSAPLARIYPYVFDAMLVLAGCSVLALRGAGLPSRIYGWLCFLVLLAALAAGGVVHAARIHVPRHVAGVAGAIVPFVFVLISFGLLLALLRNARLRRMAQRSAGSARPDNPGQAGPGGEPNAGDAEYGPGQALQGGASGAGSTAISGSAAISGTAAFSGTAEFSGTAAISGQDLGAENSPHEADAPQAAGAPAGAGAPGGGQGSGDELAGAPASSASIGPADIGPAGTEPAGRPGVRPAEMQLRARSPRPSQGTAEAAATPPDHGPAAGPGSQSPLLPPVGTSAMAEQPGTRMRRTNPRFARWIRSSGYEETSAQDEPAGPGTTTPATADVGSPASQTSPPPAGAQPDSAETGPVGPIRSPWPYPPSAYTPPLTPADTADPVAEADVAELSGQADHAELPAQADDQPGSDQEAEPAQPPAFQRPHSSPTPPES